MRPLTLLPSLGLSFGSGLLLTALSLPACSGPQRISGIDAEVTTAGSVEITAELLEIPGKFPSNDLYDYAYILKYQVRTVHRGHVGSKNILVAHYNPLKARSKAENEFSGKVGGTVRRFREGDLHRLALEEPLDDHYMGGVIDKFEEEGTRYWSLWANLVTE